MSMYQLHRLHCTGPDCCHEFKLILRAFSDFPQKLALTGIIRNMV